MVPAIHNYWLGIMAAAFAVAMALWIWLVLRADKHPHGYQNEIPPMRREVLGGAFVARDGGRQVVPDPREPAESPANVTTVAPQRQPSHNAGPAAYPAGSRSGSEEPLVSGSEQH